ncbi:unnamed protein product [Schistosoma curassoni]|uniref:Protein FAR1-RELATED SEQUENCE n=1 Tax=Schistosoma curassoni TaxID=6186 RepID=A0A183L297_9TREM|nr:unnamed protein product [Schistosoma curassoni]
MEESNVPCTSAVVSHVVTETENVFLTTLTSMNTQCPAFIFCKLIEGYWTVVRGNVHHNHECNSLRYDSNSWVRRLTEAEFETVRPLLISRTAAFDIKHFAYHSYGKHLNDQDIFNMRYKVFSHPNLPGKQSVYL